MTWMTIDKEIEITRQIAHICTLSGVSGAALSATPFDFTPDEFHLAAAMCSHMHPVTPSAAGPEATMIRSLVAHHVDDIRRDFAIESSADGFKDFVKSYFSGTVATGLAYLAMVRSGYHWAGHFEHLKPAATKGRTPDFVFGAEDKGICLVESKGTRSAAITPFDATVEEGYLQQVERHLGKTLNSGVQASHGYCIGAWMTSVSKAELIVHHSASPAPGGAGAGDRVQESSDEMSPGEGLAAVQQQDHATAFTLAFGTVTGEAIRAGAIEALPPLAQFSWLDRTWVTGAYPWIEMRPDLDLYFEDLHPADWIGFPPARRRYFYAIETSILRAILARFWGGEALVQTPELQPLNRDVINLARRERYGAALPNGLALVRRSGRLRGKRVRWNPQIGDFES
jgi:hypothetical protein